MLRKSKVIKSRLFLDNSKESRPWRTFLSSGRLPPILEMLFLCLWPSVRDISEALDHKLFSNTAGISRIRLTLYGWLPIAHLNCCWKTIRIIVRRKRICLLAPIFKPSILVLMCIQNAESDWLNKVHELWTMISDMKLRREKCSAPRL